MGNKRTWLWALGGLLVGVIVAPKLRAVVPGASRLPSVG